jgi:hypothetical protein
MKDGKLPSADGAIYSGQELVVPLLERCLKWCDIVEEKYNVPRKPRKMLTLGRKGRIDEQFQDTYDKLIAIRNHLDKLLLTKAWSLRETDLYMWHRKLDRIDDSRRDGNFFDADGRPADLHAQRVGLKATGLVDD